MKELSRMELASLKRLEKNIAPDRKKLTKIDEKISNLLAEREAILARMKGTLDLIKTYKGEEDEESHESISTSDGCEAPKEEENPVSEMLMPETNN